MDFILKDLYTLSVFFLKQVWDFIVKITNIFEILTA